ncbi:ABC transporter substrate-binding protein [Neorhizobium sp. DT-125]|uniref:ABC transporter substrate-binding protein n=1 Tax=Neorhizobium sp. DT-125 TaxID=3396163 RepID=UPI003F1CC366
MIAAAGMSFLGLVPLRARGETGIATARPQPRVAVLARWIAETIVAMGIPPAAVPELTTSDSIWQDMPLLEHTVDLGLTGEPNLELLDQLRLDYIFIEGRFQSARWEPLFRQIAPVIVSSIYTAERKPLQTAHSETLRFGELLSSPEEAQKLIGATDAILDEHDKRFSSAKSPVFVVRILDDRNVMLYCAGSLFDAVLAKFGLRNACRVASDWGFLTIGIDSLASEPDAWIIHFEPPTEGPLAANPLWLHLPAVKAGRLTSIPELYSWGGLPTARRFAELLLERLPDGLTG